MANIPMTKNESTPVNQLHIEYDRQNALFELQLPIIQRFLEAQARQIAEAYAERAQHVRFTLPDRVISSVGSEPITVKQAVREQRVGNFSDRLARRDVHDTLRQRLTELEQSSDQAIVIAANLIRFASATHMVRNMLPSGRVVAYVPVEEDDIPSVPSAMGWNRNRPLPLLRCDRGRRECREWSWQSPGAVCARSEAILPAPMGGVRR